ncbi:Psathyrella Velutina lectin At 1.5a resolution [Mycena capillaripes]|nr:Psathyrella Velutina lectin At 1.5a resolution [Mycena capillaripes]
MSLSKMTKMTSEVFSQTLPVPTASPGVADIVGFGTQGVVILRNSISIKSVEVIKNFGYDAGGWRTERHVRLIADTTGDKQADIVGFGENGVWISANKGNNTFTDPPKMVLTNFSCVNGGWSVEKHIRFMCDIRNIGRADIVGFGDAGVVISRNNGGGSFSPPELAVADFGYNSGGWRLDRHLRFLADVTGDGLLDIVGFGDSQVLIGRNNGNGTFQPGQGVIGGFCYSAGGWRIEKHPRFVADLSGDGRADLIGFGDAGVYVSLNNGDGAFGPVTLVLNTFGYDAGGWRVEKHPRFIASLTGDKRGDIVGFGDDGVIIAINNGDGTFQPARRAIDSCFGYNQGWRVEKHPRFVVDLTGDGRADIIRFGEDSVWVSYNNGGGNFGPPTKLIDNFAYSGGWTLENTVRYVANLYQ